MPKRKTSHDREIGRRIRVRRQELGLSQTELGNALQVSFQQVQKYEKGTNRISAGRLQELAQVLNVPVTFFFEDLAGPTGGSKISEMLESVYAIRLLKAFSKIRDRNVQRTAVELIEAMTDSPKR
jgi:transcriptional regulator with XRE-family HTH domain